MKALFSALVLAATLAGSIGGEPMRAELKSDRVAIFNGGRLFTEYLFTADEKYPYFFPVNGPHSGESVTSRRNEKYPHHSSIFFGCDRVDGGNFWQEGNDRGRIVSKDVRLVRASGDEVVFEQDCRWERLGSEAPFSDHRRIAISAPSAEERIIDFDITLTALLAVRIEKTNHSLFSVRMAPDLSPTGGGSLTNAHGGSAERGTFGRPAPWADCRGTRGGATEGVAVLVHPDNRWSPSPWFTRDYGFLSPTPMNWIDAKGVAFAPGEKLRLRYRVIVHGDNPRPAALQAHFERWAGLPSAPSTVQVPPKVQPSAAGPLLKVSLAMRDGMRFDPPRFAAQPGQEVLVEIENADTTHQMHNFLVVRPGKLKAVVEAALQLGEHGPEKQFNPATDDVLIASALLQPEQKTRVRFRLPETAGIHPYVCTFPGHGVVMFGAIYSGVPMPAADKDPNIPQHAAQSLVAGGGRRPFVQRMFMPDAGPAAIAVALPDGQNFCWDAGQCRLRYAWRGAFIDARGYWGGNGSRLAEVPVAPWWRAPKQDFPLRFGRADAPPPDVAFLGYDLDGGVPEFHYRVAATEVFEKIVSTPGGAALELHYRIPRAQQPLTCQLPGGIWKSSAGSIDNGVLTLSTQQAAAFTLTLTEPDGLHPHSSKP